MALIQKSMDNIAGLNDTLANFNNRISEIEHRVFQQKNTPSEGVNDGDIWLDTSDDTLKVYREYPLGSGVYRWEPLLYKWDDTVDGGNWGI